MERVGGVRVKSLCWHVSGTSRAAVTFGWGCGSPSVCRRRRADPAGVAAARNCPEEDRSPAGAPRESAAAYGEAYARTDYGKAPRTARNAVTGWLGIRQVNGVLPPLSALDACILHDADDGGGTGAAMDVAEGSTERFGIGGRRWVNAIRRLVEIELGGGRVLRHPGRSGRRAGRDA